MAAEAQVEAELVVVAVEKPVDLLAVAAVKLPAAKLRQQEPAVVARAALAQAAEETEVVETVTEAVAVEEVGSTD